MTDLQSTIKGIFSDDWLNMFDYPYLMVPNRPTTDVVEQEKEFIVKMDIPDMDKKDIQINYSNNELTVSGEKKNESETKKDYHKKERFYGKFSRSFSIDPALIDIDNITSKYLNGTLTITLPKSESASKKIDIVIE